MTGFLRPDEEKLGHEFLERGYVIRPAADRAGLDAIQACVAQLAAAFLGEAVPADAKAYLDSIHLRLDPARINELRLAVIQGINAEPWLRPAYFAAARDTIETIVGNELCMQRRVNLSVQLPGDETSVLAAHADAWSGDSPFEVVVWIPLVDCFATKAMFLAPPSVNAAIAAGLAAHSGVEAAFKAHEDEVEFIPVSYGDVLVFDQTLMHGNRVNGEAETRWSMNCRFKAILSPYADKKLGEFFEPITLRPASRLGMAYRYPKGFQRD